MTLPTALSLALATLPGLAQDAPPFTDLDVPSANGWYRAEVRRAAGYEDKPPHLARWRVAVFEVLENVGEKQELWSAPYAYDGTSRHYVLANDGSTLVHVLENFQNYRAVVTIVREGRPVSGPTGSAFDLEPRSIERTAAGKRWLADGGVPDGTHWLETDTGPRLVLPLRLRDGREHVLDVEDGRVWSGADFAALAAVEVAPALAERLVPHVRIPYVRHFEVPEVVRAGHPVPVIVSGDHPTPGWRFEAFVLEQSGELGRDLTLTPRSRFPTGDAAQVLSPFRGQAELVGLVPGSYRVRVLGRAKLTTGYAPLEVLPADHVLTLRRTGGIAGVDERWEVLGRGEARFRSRGESRVLRIPGDTLARFVELVDRFPARGGASRSEGSADRFAYTVTWWDGALPLELSVGEATAGATVRELVELLTALR